MKIQQERKTVQNWIDKELSNRRSVFYKVPFKSVEIAKKCIYEAAKYAAEETAQMNLAFDFNYTSYNYNFIQPLNIDSQNGVEFILWIGILSLLFTIYINKKDKIANPNGTQTGVSDLKWRDIWNLITNPRALNFSLGNY